MEVTEMGSKSKVNKTLTMILTSFPEHELEWLQEALKQTKSEIIRAAIIQYAAYWREQIDQKKLDQVMDQ